MGKKLQPTIEDVVGEPVEIELQGKKFTLSPPTLADLASLAQFVKDEERKETEKNLQQYVTVAKNSNIPIEDQIKVIDKLASKNMDKGMGILENLDSPIYTQYLLWKCLSKKHKKLTFEQVGELVSFNNMSTINDALITILFGRNAELENDIEGDQENPTQKGK